MIMSDESFFVGKWKNDKLQGSETFRCLRR